VTSTSTGHVQIPTGLGRVHHHHPSPSTEATSSFSSSLKTMSTPSKVTRSRFEYEEGGQLAYLDFETVVAGSPSFIQKFRPLSVEKV
jgi:hypothetical protein